jgi:4,5-DOPA dioxygenase extradiol
MNEERDMLPTLFISHGSPMILVDDSKSHHFLKNIAKEYKQPKQIIVISAHNTTKELSISYSENPSLIYDFYNFPRELYEMEYSVKNDLSFCDKVINLYQKNGIKISKDTRGYDHGVWVPLKLMYPNANIPVVSLSLPLLSSVDELIKIGDTLKSLRDDTLIVASGSLTHNLRDIDFGATSPKTYAKEFREYVVAKIANGDIDSIKEYKSIPHFAKNHPTNEHFLPLLVAMGASSDRVGEVMSSECLYSNIYMDMISFES